MPKAKAKQKPLPVAKVKRREDRAQQVSLPPSPEATLFYHGFTKKPGNSPLPYVSLSKNDATVHLTPSLSTASAAYHDFSAVAREAISNCSTPKQRNRRVSQASSIQHTLALARQPFRRLEFVNYDSEGATNEPEHGPNSDSENISESLSQLSKEIPARSDDNLSTTTSEENFIDDGIPDSYNAAYHFPHGYYAYFTST